MNKVATEYEVQCDLVDYLELLKRQKKILLFTSIPNSTFTTSWRAKFKNKKSGLRCGMPDLIIVTPKSILFLEMKREKGGVISAEQKKWISILPNKQTFAGVAKGFDNAKMFIDSLISEEH